LISTQIETGLPPELVRLSVGIEHIDDIIKVRGSEQKGT